MIAKRLALNYWDAVLRGYGQLFLCNNRFSGALLFFGLALVSPENAAWSLLGAGLATLGAFLCGARAETASGLFGVNGALLGCAWIYFPEVGTSAKAGLTVFGSFVIVLILVPSLRWLIRTKSGITPFAIPSLLAIGLNLLLLQMFGAIDLNLQRGWGALATGDVAKAKQCFEAVQLGSSKGQAYRSEGLGWAEYRLKNYTSARDHFLQADLVEANSGAGWCSLQLGEYERAKKEFAAALDRGTRNADAWEGLGWSYSACGQTDSARACFRRSILLTPLRVDSYRGLSPNETANLIEANVSRQWQSVSSAQWLSWVLALLGIAYHSRWSLMMTAGAVCMCGVLGLLSDPAVLYNLVPLVIALGGHYLRITPVTILWTAAMVLVLALAWPAGTAFFSALGLPMLCIPFHLFFIPSLLLFQSLTRKGITTASVPFGLAVTTPENVARWFQKAEFARDCWERLRSDNRQIQQR